MSISSRTRTTSTCLALAIALVAAIVGSSPEPASAASTDGQVISLDYNETRGVEHIRANDRIVIAGDDVVEIRDGAGTLVHSVSGVAGASLPTENKLHFGPQGDLTVVYAAGTNELVVIDTSNGSITQRINPGASLISSIVFIGDTIWYAHGPDQWDAGVGQASATTGLATAFAWDDSVYAGSEIDVSPSTSDQVIFTRRQLSPSNIYRLDDGLPQATRGPDHRSFHPLAIQDDGATIWAFNDSAIAEVRPSDLGRTGRTIATESYWPQSLMIVDDTNIVVRDRGFVETRSIANGTQVAMATFDAVETVDVDATTTELFTVLVENQLVISGLNYVYVPPVEPIVQISGACPAVTDSVTRLYSAYFLRAPDAEGWAFWVNDYAAGRNNMDSMSNFFAQSPEFGALYGSLTDGAFIDLVYTNVLGRNPDSEGRQFWMDQLASGAINRGRLMINFSESEEYVGLTGTAVPLAGYFNWYPAGTTFYCATGDKVFELGVGDKFIDFHAANTTGVTRSYEIQSRFDGEWYDDVSTTLFPSSYEAFLGVTVNMEAISVRADSDLGWVFVQSPTPLPSERAGWPFLLLHGGDADTDTEFLRTGDDDRSLIGS